METPVLDFLQGPESTAFAIFLALGIALSGAAIAAIFISPGNQGSGDKQTRVGDKE